VCLPVAERPDGLCVFLTQVAHSHTHPALQVMPMLERGDLHQAVVAAPGGLPVRLARRYFRQVCEGLLQLKHCGFAHGWVTKS
jgi:hypothetical protein